MIARRLLAGCLDVVFLVLLLALSAIAWVPLMIFAGFALGSTGGWEGWGLGMASVAVAAIVTVTAAYAIHGVRRGGTRGHRLAGLAVVRHNGRAPTLPQATIRYVVGLLVPLALPVLVDEVATSSWKAYHGERPRLEIRAGHLTVAREALLADREWESLDRRARAWLAWLRWILYAAELGLMALWPWHDRLAGTVIVRRGSSA